MVLKLISRNRTPPQVTNSSLFSDFPSTSSSVACSCRISSFIDRKSTRLNSSHVAISYAVFCLKKKIYYGCVVVEDRALFSPTAVITGICKRGFEANKTKLTKLDAEIEAGVCYVKLSIDPETG